MTLEQKNKILSLSKEGKSSREIADEVKIHFTTVADFVKSYPSDKIKEFKQCPNCLKDIAIPYRNGFVRIFCCDACKREYYRVNKTRKKFKRVCEWCGKEFLSYRFKKTRFCSKSCAKKQYHYERLQKKS